MHHASKVNGGLTRAAVRVLQPAEWVRARAVLHRSIYMPAVAVLAIWAPILAWAHLDGLDLLAGLALVVVGAGAPLLLVWAWLRARTNIVLLTDRRLIAVSGPLPRRVTALALDAIDTVHVRPARLGGAAVLHVSPFLDTGLPSLEMRDLARAQAFADQIRAARGPHRP